MGFMKSVVEFFTGGEETQKPPEPSALPQVPTEQDALLKAQERAEKRRKSILLSGGNVNPTGGKGAVLSEGQLARKTLLGQ